jgi:hypothetical protein
MTQPMEAIRAILKSNPMQFNINQTYIIRKDWTLERVLTEQEEKFVKDAGEAISFEVQKERKSLGLI